MGDQRLIAVDRLQKQEIGDLGSAAAARFRNPARQTFAALVEQTLELVYEAAEFAGGVKVA